MRATTALTGASLLAALVPEGVAVVPVLPVLLGLDALFVVLVLVDFLRTPRPDRIELVRSLPRAAGLSQGFEREVAIEAPARACGALVELHEEFPDCFRVELRTTASGKAPPLPGDPTGGPDTLRLDDEGRGVAGRVYRSERRGVHRLGDLRLVVHGPLGLVDRRARWAGGQEVAIESALADLRSTLALAASERWRDLGVRRIRRRGGQTEFESLRDYVRGDDVRLVDWKAFAKRGKPTVRQYQEERGQELVLLFDCGRRMRATAPGALTGATPGTTGGEVVADAPVLWSKLDWALDAGLQLAAVALQHGDRVGCVVYDDRVRAFVPPARGKRQFARLGDAVFAFQPSRRDSDLARALRELGVRHRRRATVVILSDVADPLSVDVERRALASGSRRHQLVFAGLDDPEVRGAALSGAATGAALRATAVHAVATRRSSLRALASSGARVLDALPAEAAGPLLAAWLDARRNA